MVTSAVSNPKLIGVLIVLTACLVSVFPAFAEDGINGNLVTVDWLNKNLKNPDVLILDVSDTGNYPKGHIPGAISVELYSFAIQEPPPAVMSLMFQSWGVSPGKKIVMYDTGASSNAPRLLFALQYYGYPISDLYVLDGGLPKWKEKGFPTTNEATTPAKGTFISKSTNEDLRIRTPEVVTASGDTKNHVLVDALEPEWHFGEIHPFNKAGHIPNSVLLSGQNFFNADKTFKSPDEIRKMLAYYGIRPDQQIHSYCGGGVAAAGPWFAIKYIVKYPHVDLYKESELGWLSDERDLPYWTYDTPRLMRDSSWLQFWDNQRIRSFVGAKISVIDIRPTDAFNQGHVPFALNIPADTFRQNLNSPDKLAALLGPAGVDAAHEAVIISGSGITKDSALALLMLDKLGQSRTSIFTDSMDQWTKGGFDIKKDATVVAPKKNPFDPSIPPTTYPTSFRNGVMISDAKSTHSDFPKIFIASGANAPAKSPDGKVVHVPYTDLVNPDGTPKAAKDIWSALSKAGVPRFAELICFSNDPGEAAVNYYILKLMGFPDVKVLRS